LGELFFHLRAQAFQLAKLLIADGGAQVGHVVDIELVSEAQQRFRAESRDLAELDEGRWKFLPQLVDFRDLARIEELTDFFRRALADTVDLRQLPLGERRQIAAMRLDGFLRVLVGAYAESVGRAFVQNRELRELTKQSDEGVVGTAHETSL